MRMEMCFQRTGGSRFPFERPGSRRNSLPVQKNSDWPGRVFSLSGQSPTARGHRCRSNSLILVVGMRLGNLAVNYPTSSVLQGCKANLSEPCPSSRETGLLRRKSNLKSLCLGNRCVSILSATEANNFQHSPVFRYCCVPQTRISVEQRGNFDGGCQML